MRILLLILVGLVLASPAFADTFTYRDEKGNQVTLEAKLHGAGQEIFALEKADGQLLLIPQAAVIERKPGKGPKPLTEEEMVKQLTEQFGEDQFRAVIKSPFVCGLVLSEPLSTSIEESRCRSFLRKTGDFMKRIESVFERYAREVHIPLESPTHPLVVLIFETDEDFEKYSVKITGGDGLSAGNVLGFYSSITNFLAIRMSECHTFETPLHEAIHQQVYNRNVLKRLAPLPAWFNEGIATGFEGNGDRITNGPVKVNSYYARIAVSQSPFGWSELISSDRTFRGDVFAGDAYRHAWSMHWLLVNNYRKEYTQYLKLLGQKEPLTVSSPEDRLKDFESCFGKPGEFQSELLPALKTEIKRQRVKFKPPASDREITQVNLAEVDFGATRTPGGIVMGGQLKNISYLRDMAYYITMETDAGLYADWHISSLSIKRSLTLKPQIAKKQVTNFKRRPPGTVALTVHAAPAISETAQTWKRGQLPRP